MRRKLSFMKSIRKCTSKIEHNETTKGRICDEILTTASNTDNHLENELNELILDSNQQTLHDEVDALGDISLRSFNNNIITLQLKYSSFQHHAKLNRTERKSQSYNRKNSLITDRARSQGSKSFTCWAYACTSMLRAACKLLIGQCHELGIIDDKRKLLSEQYITTENVHVEIRTLVMMILLPRKLHIDDQTQASCLRAAVSRVRIRCT